MAAKLAVGDWIERVYNRRRRHSALGMISPVEYEYRFTQTAQAGLHEVEGSRGLDPVWWTQGQTATGGAVGGMQR